jgi:cell division protein ZapA
MADELLPVQIQIADRSIGLLCPPEEEEYLREAGRLIRERIVFYRELGFRDTQEVLARIALDALVARLKGDDQLERTQRLVFEKVTQLNQTVAGALS